MKKQIITVLVSICLSIFACWLLVLWKAPKKQAYIENLKLYESFEGKKELETKLINVKSSNKMRIDSLRNLVKDEQTELYYRQQVLIAEEQEETMSIEYSTQIWNQLNSYIQEYGKKQGYDFIYGATGSGTMMYARQELNITEEVIKYANSNYEGKK